MKHVRTFVLDNEAVQALLDSRHRKHRRSLLAVEVVTPRRGATWEPPTVIVPTAVRVEAGWSRRTAGAASINRLPVDDHALDTTTADRAATLRSALRVSVADAHIAAVLETAPGPLAVLTSDVDDVRRIAAHLGADATVIAL